MPNSRFTSQCFAADSSKVIVSVTFMFLCVCLWYKQQCCFSRFFLLLSLCYTVFFFLACLVDIHVRIVGCIFLLCVGWVTGFKLSPVSDGALLNVYFVMQTPTFVKPVLCLGIYGILPSTKMSFPYIDIQPIL